MITDQDVKHIAALARIHISQDQVPGFTKNLEGILKYVKQLELLDVTAVNPTSHVVAFKNMVRSDHVLPSLTQKEALSVAVESKDDSFKVPLVIE